MNLTANNYYSSKANMEYCSVSQYKDFIGTPLRPGCEARALAEAKGLIPHPVTTALAVGSYVDAYFSGEIKEYTMAHPEMFSSRGATKGELKAEFRQAVAMIKRAEKEKLFMRYMDGEKQKILTGDIEGVPFKIRMDSCDGRRITDLKTIKSISETFWIKDSGERLNFIEAWNYDLQGAVYQEIYFQNFGKRLPFYICAISKDKSSDGLYHPRVAVIEVLQTHMDERLSEVKANIKKIQAIKTGEIEPISCGICDYCADTLPLEEVISQDQLLMEA